MRKIIIRVAIAAVILLAGIGVFQWHNYQQKVEYRKEALLYFKEEDYQYFTFRGKKSVQDPEEQE